jgi:serine phosphatase RsbU (regulator of sigma subunit)
VDQTRFVRSLNGEFSRLGEAGLFATALLLTYFAPADRLVTCNAGHPPPLWYRSDKRSWQRLEHDTPDRLQSASNLPLGVISPTHYHQFVVPLAKGDLILVYTDSLVEAADPHGRQLGEQGLLELVRSLDVQHPGAFPEALLEGVSRHRGDAPSEDDVTVLLLHHNAVDPPRRPVGERVNAIAKMLGLRQV